MRFILSLLICSFFILSCSEKVIPPSESAKQDYLLAKEMIGKQQYNKANMFLNDYAAKHPYSQYTTPAEILRIYAAYQNDEFILSETLAGQFISNHPDHPQKAYAQYMLAMSHYKQVNKPAHDQLPTQRSIDAFKDLIQQYPNTEYAVEAKKLLQKLYNYLAEHEVVVGRHYMKKEQYVSAVRRFQVVLEKYQTTPSIEEALYQLANAYQQLGITQSAQDTAILLRHNYPNSDWSKKAAVFAQAEK